MLVYGMISLFFFYPPLTFSSFYIVRYMHVYRIILSELFCTVFDSVKKLTNNGAYEAISGDITYSLQLLGSTTCCITNKNTGFCDASTSLGWHPEKVTCLMVLRMSASIETGRRFDSRSLLAKSKNTLNSHNTDLKTKQQKSKKPKQIAELEDLKRRTLLLNA